MSILLISREILRISNKKYSFDTFSLKCAYHTKPLYEIFWNIWNLLYVLFGFCWLIKYHVPKTEVINKIILILSIIKVEFNESIIIVKFRDIYFHETLENIDYFNILIYMKSLMTIDFVTRSFRLPFCENKTNSHQPAQKAA